MAAFDSSMIAHIKLISHVDICLNLCPVWRGQNFSVLRKRKRLDGGDGGSESLEGDHSTRTIPGRSLFIEALPKKDKSKNNRP